MCGLVRFEITKSRLFSLCTKVTVCYMFEGYYYEWGLFIVYNRKDCFGLGWVLIMFLIILIDL